MKIVKEARKARQASTAALQPSRNNISESADAEENKNLGQRPPNAGLFIFCIPWVQVCQAHIAGGPQQYQQMHPGMHQQQQQQQTVYTYHVPQVGF